MEMMNFPDDYSNPLMNIASFSDTINEQFWVTLHLDYINNLLFLLALDFGSMQDRHLEAHYTLQGPII